MRIQHSCECLCILHRLSLTTQQTLLHYKLDRQETNYWKKQQKVSFLFFLIIYVLHDHSQTPEEQMLCLKLHKYMNATATECVNFHHSFQQLYLLIAYDPDSRPAGHLENSTHASKHGITLMTWLYYNIYWASYSYHLHFHPYLFRFVTCLQACIQGLNKPHECQSCWSVIMLNVSLSPWAKPFTNNTKTQRLAINFYMHKKWWSQNSNGPQVHAYRHQAKKREEQGCVGGNKQNRRIERGRTAEGDRERKQETETEGDRVRNTSLLLGTLSVQLMRREFWS